MINFETIENIITSKGEVILITRGSEILFQKKVPKYKKELLYIESTGTQSIDTQYIPNSNTECEMVASGISKDSFVVTTGTWFFGARAGYLNRAFGSYYNPTTKQLYYAFGNVMPSAGYTTLYDSVKTFRTGANGLQIDGSLVVKVTANTFTAPTSLIIFGLNNNGSYISHTKFRLHQFKIWDQGALIRDLVPVLDWNDIPCLYDKVSEELFYNQGTDEFLYGDDD